MLIAAVAPLACVSSTVLVAAVSSITNAVCCAYLSLSVLVAAGTLLMRICALTRMFRPFGAGFPQSLGHVPPDAWFAVA